MIILTKINQLDNINTIIDKLKADISQSISILNTAYGVDRDVYNDLGGFCCIVSKEEDIKFLLDRWNVDILNDISEVTLEIDGYIKKAFHHKFRLCHCCIHKSKLDRPTQINNELVFFSLKGGFSNGLFCGRLFRYSYSSCCCRYSPVKNFPL